MSNNQGNNELAIGLMIFAMIAIALLVAGVVVALIAVTGFVANEWRKIYRYEGKVPIQWLAGITAVIALPLMGGAMQQFRLFAFHLERQSDQWFGHALGAIFFIVLLAAPTAAYWIYRKIEPISHVRVGLIETWHDQYAKAEITKHERDQKIAKTIATGDTELERMMVASRRQSQTQTSHHSQAATGAAFDVPEQD